MRRAFAAAVVVGVLAGCGSSSELPPPAAPAQSPPLTERPAGKVVASAEKRAEIDPEVASVDGGRAVARLSPRRRVLEVGDEKVAAGVGPTHVIGGPGRLIYVVDTGGDGLLVYELRPRLHLTRRYPLLGSPYGIAADPGAGRLWVTMTRTNQLVELADGALPHRLRALPSVRQPNAVRVERHRVYVTGSHGVVQIVDGRDTPPPTPGTARR
jgi:streptogramin lyase